MACLNPPGSWVQPSLPGEKAPPWGGTNQAASGRDPSGGWGSMQHSVGWGLWARQPIPSVPRSVRLWSPPHPGGLGQLVCCQPGCPAGGVNHSENSSLCPPRPQDQPAEPGAQGPGLCPGSEIRVKGPSHRAGVPALCPRPASQLPAALCPSTPPRHQVEGPHRPLAEPEPWHCSGLLALGGRVLGLLAALTPHDPTPRPARTARAWDTARLARGSS